MAALVQQETVQGEGGVVPAHPEVIRLLPPLNVTTEVVDTAGAILLDVLQECCPSPVR
ncbi:MAG: hypothetical protein ACRDRV_14025 [Pseudonocardiaceae bacterium]